MTIDDTILEDVEKARIALEDLEARAYETRAAMHQSIRRLHAAGASMREIATALGMSHQRVHQIIGEEGIVEVETTATEVGHLPVPVTAAVAVTGGEDSCSFCGAPRRELEKLLAAPGPVFICSGCVAGASHALKAGSARGLQGDGRLVPVEEDATCSYCGNPSGIGGVMVEAESGAPRICTRCITSCERLIGNGEEPKKVLTRRSTKIRCSFCNVSQTDTKKLIAGPGVYICESCVAGATEISEGADAVKGRRQVVLRDATSESHGCGFCGKVPSQVKRLAKGGRGRICNECVKLCNDILAEESGG